MAQAEIDEQRRRRQDDHAPTHPHRRLRPHSEQISQVKHQPDRGDLLGAKPEQQADKGPDCPGQACGWPGRTQRPFAQKHGSQAKGHRQRVRRAGNVGDRRAVHGMHRPNQRNAQSNPIDAAAVPRVRQHRRQHLSKHQAQQKGVGRVDEQTRQMVTKRIQAPEPVVSEESQGLRRAVKI